jgi:hypothetical protein
VGGAEYRGDEAGCNLITFCDSVFNDNFDVGKRAAKLIVKQLKASRTAQGSTRITGESLGHAVRGKHLVDSIGAAFVPHLFKPASQQRLIIF